MERLKASQLRAQTVYKLAENEHSGSMGKWYITFDGIRRLGGSAFMEESHHVVKDIR